MERISRGDLNVWTWLGVGMSALMVLGSAANLASGDLGFLHIGTVLTGLIGLFIGGNCVRHMGGLRSAVYRNSGCLVVKQHRSHKAVPFSSIESATYCPAAPFAGLVVVVFRENGSLHRLRFVPDGWRWSHFLRDTVPADVTCLLEQIDTAKR